MNPAAPWICPRCTASNAPHVDRCGCSPAQTPFPFQPAMPFPAIMPFNPPPWNIGDVTCITVETRPTSTTIASLAAEGFHFGACAGGN